MNREKIRKKRFAFSKQNFLASNGGQRFRIPGYLPQFPKKISYVPRVFRFFSHIFRRENAANQYDINHIMLYVKAANIHSFVHKSKKSDKSQGNSGDTPWRM
jgi:hypothetical protein